MFKSKKQYMIDRLGREINEIKTDFRVSYSASDSEIKSLRKEVIDLKLYEIESEATLRNHKKTIEENRDKISSLKTIVWLLISSLVFLAVYLSVKDAGVFKIDKGE